MRFILGTLLLAINLLVQGIAEAETSDCQELFSNSSNATDFFEVHPVNDGLDIMINRSGEVEVISNPFHGNSFTLIDFNYDLTFNDLSGTEFKLYKEKKYLYGIDYIPAKQNEDKTWTKAEFLYKIFDIEKQKTHEISRTEQQMTENVVYNAQTPLQAKPYISFIPFKYNGKTYIFSYAAQVVFRGNQWLVNFEGMICNFYENSFLIGTKNLGVMTTIQNAEAPKNLNHEIYDFDGVPLVHLMWGEPRNPAANNFHYLFAPQIDSKDIRSVLLSISDKNMVETAIAPDKGFVIRTLNTIQQGVNKYAYKIFLSKNKRFILERIDYDTAMTGLSSFSYAGNSSNGPTIYSVTSIPTLVARRNIVSSIQLSPAQGKELSAQNEVPVNNGEQTTVQVTPTPSTPLHQPTLFETIISSNRDPNMAKSFEKFIEQIIRDKKFTTAQLKNMRFISLKNEKMDKQITMLEIPDGATFYREFYTPGNSPSKLKKPTNVNITWGTEIYNATDGRRFEATFRPFYWGFVEISPEESAHNLEQYYNQFITTSLDPESIEQLEPHLDLNNHSSLLNFGQQFFSTIQFLGIEVSNLRQEEKPETYLQQVKEIFRDENALNSPQEMLRLSGMLRRYKQSLIEALEKANRLQGISDLLSNKCEQYLQYFTKNSELLEKFGPAYTDAIVATSESLGNNQQIIFGWNIQISSLHSQYLSLVSTINQALDYLSAGPLKISAAKRVIDEFKLPSPQRVIQPARETSRTDKL